MTDEQLAEIKSLMEIEDAPYVEELIAALEAERAKVARVRELHRPTPNIAECGIERGCTKCRSEWPCETILALDGEVMNDGRTEQGGKWTYEREETK
jgi:hypothetical protein